MNLIQLRAIIYWIGMWAALILYEMQTSKIQSAALFVIWMYFAIEFLRMVCIIKFKD